MNHTARTMNALYCGIAALGLTVGLAPKSYARDDNAKEAVPAEEIVSLKAGSFEIPGSKGICMIRIEKGQFMMGSPENEAGREAGEIQHTVTISHPFYMAEDEITQEQYIPINIPDYKPMFTGKASWGTSLPELHSNGPFHTPGPGIVDSSRHPMEGVTWDKAVEFCTALTERERQAGRLPKGYVYRLPTEAEWEYACRAGSTGRFNVDGTLGSFAAAGGLKTTVPVKEERKPNAWGLYDMHGNVYEWCLDWYGNYDGKPATDPVGPAEGTKKVARGGCYLSGTGDSEKPDPAKEQRWLRSAARGRFLPDLPLPIVGLRVVLGPEI